MGQEGTEEGQAGSGSIDSLNRFDFDKALDAIRAAAAELEKPEVQRSLAILGEAANAVSAIHDAVKAVAVQDAVKVLALQDAAKAVHTIQDAVKAVAIQDAVKAVAIQDAVKAVAIQDAVKAVAIQDAVKAVALRPGPTPTSAADDQTSRILEIIRGAAQVFEKDPSQ